MSDTIKRRRRTRDTSRAITLRPIEVYELFGIPPSTLNDLANHSDESKRIPSSLIPGRCGRKGIRIFKKADIEAYIERFATKGAA